MFPARHYQCSDNKWHLLLATILLSMWLSSATGEGAEAINGEQSVTLTGLNSIKTCIFPLLTIPECGAAYITNSEFDVVALNFVMTIS